MQGFLEKVHEIVMYNRTSRKNESARGTNVRIEQQVEVKVCKILTKISGKTRIEGDTKEIIGRRGKMKMYEVLT